MLPHLRDPRDAPGLAQGRATGSVKTMQAPHPGLLTFLPSSPGVPSSPWGHRLSVSTQLNLPSTGTAWDTDHTRDTAQSMGTLCCVSPLPLCWTGVNSPWEPQVIPKSKSCSPYSRSCRWGQVCHHHRVCPGRKQQQ